MDGNGAILSAHSAKNKARLVNRAELAQVPTPQGTWSWKPIPHADLVTTLDMKLGERGWSVAKEQLAVTPNGMKLFGTFDLARTDGGDGGLQVPGTGTALGFRASNDRSIRIEVCAGARVFVCDNMAFSGDSILMARKHTRGLYLGFEIDRALDGYFQYLRNFETDVNRAMATRIGDRTAKVLLFDLFNQGILSPSLFDRVAANYFKAETLGLEDSKPRSIWGLHNACTRALKDMTPASAFTSTQKLGRFLLSPDVKVAWDERKILVAQS